MSRFQAAALGAIPDASAREEAQEVETRAMEARAEAEEERAKQEAALRASALEEEEALEARARRREEATVRYEQAERLSGARRRSYGLLWRPRAEPLWMMSRWWRAPTAPLAPGPFLHYQTLRERSPHSTRWADLMEGDAPGLQPQRPLLWNMAYGEALKLQETAKAKGNSALKGKGVPMDLLQPPPARTLATGQPRGSDGHTRSSAAR